MSKHTKGPWKIDEGFIVGPDFESIADPRMLPPTADNIATMEANAALIAAAPDLLEALNRAMHWMDCHDMATADTQVRDDIAFARAAIKKAEAE